MKLTITNERLINGIAKHYNYQNTVKDENDNDIPNPQTKDKFVRQWFMNHARDCAKFEEHKEIGDAEKTRINTEIDNIDFT